MILSFANDRHMGGIADKKERKIESKFKEIMTDWNDD